MADLKTIAAMDTIILTHTNAQFYVPEDVCTFGFCQSFVIFLVRIFALLYKHLPGAIYTEHSFFCVLLYLHADVFD